MPNHISNTPENHKKIKRWIIVLSIIIPLGVGMLTDVKIEGYDFSFLPGIYATINATTAIVLISSLIAVKNKRITLHKQLMNLAFALSLTFLALYTVYHATSDSTSYEGAYSTLYYSVLISHIILSAIVVPMVLFTYFYGWKGDIVRHKKWNRISYPIWLYVALSGVLVYIMISPFY